jgi:hypothetical protein
MNDFLVPFARQELLHHMLQVGGRAECTLHRDQLTVQADLQVELTETHATIQVELAGLRGQLTLKRSDRAGHLHLRDFIQDIANGRIESAAPVERSPTIQQCRHCAHCQGRPKATGESLFQNRNFAA